MQWPLASTGTSLDLLHQWLKFVGSIYPTVFFVKPFNTSQNSYKILENNEYFIRINPIELDNNVFDLTINIVILTPPPGVIDREPSITLS